MEDGSEMTKNSLWGLFSAIALTGGITVGQNMPTYQMENAVGIPNYGVGGPARMAQLFQPQWVTGNEDGDVYLAMPQRIFMVDYQTGLYSHVAGTGARASSGDGGPATKAAFSNIYGVAYTGHFLYVAQRDPCYIRRIDLDTGIVEQVAGTGDCPGAADAAPFTGPAETTPVAPNRIVADSDGNLIISTRARVVRLDVAAGELVHIAGTGVLGDGGTDGPAVNADMQGTTGVAVDPSGNIYVTEPFGNRISRIDAASGNLTRIPTVTTSPDAIALNSTGTKLFVAGRNAVRVINLNTMENTFYLGDGNGNVLVEDQPSAEARFYHVLSGMWVNASDELIVVDDLADTVAMRRSDGIVTRIAGGEPFGDGTFAQSITFTPYDVAVAPDGRLLISDTRKKRLFEAVGGRVKPIAGASVFGTASAGDGGPAIQATLQPTQIASDEVGRVYSVDSLQMRPRVVSPDGSISSIGNNYFGTLSGLAVDPSGNPLYLSHISGHRILAFDSDAGTSSVVAGLGGSGDAGSAGFSGDGGPATAAQLSSPLGIALGAEGTLYVADIGNRRVRAISAGGTITTVAGNGELQGANVTQGGPTSIGIGFPVDVAVSSDGNLFILSSDATFVRSVWRLDAASGQLYRIAGGTDAETPIVNANGIAVDGRGIVYVANQEAGNVLALLPSDLEGPWISGIITPGAFGAGDTLAPAGWFEIYGMNLATDTMDWSNSFSGSNAPTSLLGTSVMVDGSPAALSLVSPTQINGQAGDGVIPGSTSLQVVGPAGESNAVALKSAQRAGMLLAPPSFAADGKQYVVAILPDGA